MLFFNQFLEMLPRIDMCILWEFHYYKQLLIYINEPNLTNFNHHTCTILSSILHTPSCDALVALEIFFNSLVLPWLFLFPVLKNSIILSYFTTHKKPFLSPHTLCISPFLNCIVSYLFISSSAFSCLSLIEQITLHSRSGHAIEHHDKRTKLLKDNWFWIMLMTQCSKLRPPGYTQLRSRLSQDLNILLANGSFSISSCETKSCYVSPAGLEIIAILFSQALGLQVWTTMPDIARLF